MGCLFCFVFALLKHRATPVVSRSWAIGFQIAAVDCGSRLPPPRARLPDACRTARLSFISSIKPTPTDARKTKLRRAWRCCNLVATRPRAYAPTTFQNSRRRPASQLSQKCQASDEASCRALDAVACDNGDSAVCARLDADYAKLYSSCKSGNASDCESLSLSVWPKAQTAIAVSACENGDTIACRVASSSASAMKVNVNKNAQFATF